MCTHTEAVTVAIGLGGNVGDVPAHFASAKTMLAQLEGITQIQCSPLYRSAAWGHVAQPDFINAVWVLRCMLSAPVLLQHLLAIERAHGRDRSREVRWGQRRLDLDVLLFGHQSISTAALTVPHPQMHRRAFVLRPLLDIWPDAQIIGHGSALQCWQALPQAEQQSVALLAQAI